MATAKKHQTERRSAFEADYRAFFHGLDDRRIVFRADDPKFTFIDVTDAHSQMTGVPRDKLIGRGFFEVFPDVSEKYQKTGVSDLLLSFQQLIRTKKPFFNDIMRYDIPDAEGGYLERYWQPSHYPILDENGDVAYILQTSRDVTGEIINERDIRNMRDQLQEALEVGRVGSWVWDIESDVVIADSGLAKLFGVTEKQAAAGLPLQTFIDAIHPDDRKAVTAAIGKVIKQGGNFENEYRTVGPSGEVRWVLARGKLESRNGQKLFPGVIVDITERRNLQAQVELARQQDRLNRRAAASLQQRNEQLQEVARTKDEFVALASHQLRTPATAVKQYLGMVMQGYVGEISELQAEMLGKAFESNERQIQIVNQILNAARADTGRLVMTKQAVDLATLCRAIADDIRGAIEQRGHTFTIDIPAGPAMVHADSGYMRMAIENLLHNASIYTPEGGKVTLRLEKSKDGVRLSVTDTGVGIKKADQSKLFEKFSRIHNPLSVQAGGSGIGLYLAAEIVRLHEGRLSVESKLHKGTKFTVSLPSLTNADNQRNAA